MSKRIPSEEHISNNIEALVRTIYETRIESDENKIYWTLFFNDLGIFEKNEKIYECDIGAISLAISALCASKDNSRYKTSIEKAIRLLVELRNEDGSWTSVWKRDQKNEGIVYNTFVALQALVDFGYLEHGNSIEYTPDLTNRIQFIMKTVLWIYNQRKTIRNGIGWGYSGDRSRSSIYIMPTVNILLAFKLIAFKIVCNQPDCISKGICSIEEKSIFDIIDEIEESLYNFKDVKTEGWGRKANDNERIVYTLYAIYGFTYLQKEFDEKQKTESEIQFPKKKFSFEDVKKYEKKIIKWQKKGKFKIKSLNSLAPEEVFDTYVQVSKNEQEIHKLIIDHESFFEPLAIKSITQFIITNDDKLSKWNRYMFYKIICSLNDSLEIRQYPIDTFGHMGLKSRRGLLSQSYPIYAITQGVEAWLMIQKNHRFIKNLRYYNNILVYGMASFLQLLTLFITNLFLIPEIEPYKVLLAAVIAVVSDIIKKLLLLSINYRSEA